MWRAVISPSLISLALAGCASEEERGRKVIQEHEPKLAQCAQQYRQVGQRMKAVFQLMQEGKWTEASAAQRETAPHHKASLDCLNNVKREMAKGFEHGDVSEATSQRLWEEWSKANLPPWR